MGLLFPEDLARWRRWQARRQMGRAVLGSVRARTTTGAPAPQLLLPELAPEILVVIDVWSPSCRLVIADPIAFMDPLKVAILTAIPEAVRALQGDRSSEPFESAQQLPASIGTVLSLGAFLQLSERVEAWAKQTDRRFVVVQHGLMTPWAPPLNRGDHLLAWSEADARFWSADRKEITFEVVGSQMLWNAGQNASRPLQDERPVMLGQLHGIEMSRLDKQQVYTGFCRATSAEYRPHPNEVDALSRMQHAAMRSAGVAFSSAAQPLIELRRPIVSIFSTGTIEAAQSGLPAWVYHPDPPPWLTEFWSRYRLSQFGSEPTPRLAMPQLAPAAGIAQAVNL